MAIIHYAPICQDTYLNVAASGYSYYIELEDENIFSGKAIRRPDAAQISIKINNICKDYLSNELGGDFRGMTNGVITNPDVCRQFNLYDSSSALTDTYWFLNSWDYDDVWAGEDLTLTQPVHKVRAVNQYVFNSYIKDLTYKTQVMNYDGIGGWKTGCGDYAIYYRQKNGGWDSFLIEGNVIRKDNVTRYSYSKDISNKTIAFENDYYQSTINGTYEMHTGWLTDSESASLAKNLATTNKAYLHNLKTDKIIPIILTDTEIEYKEFRNGRNMVSYTINAQESYTRDLQ